MATADEIWTDVPGYEGLYQVSDLGRVKSPARAKKIRDGALQPLPERLLRPTLVKRGPLVGRYLVNLWKENRYKTWLPHRLVLTAFVGPCPDGMEACHEDDDPGNNRLDNLRWDTRSANMRDRVRNGKGNQGTRHHQAKLTDEQVREIRTRFKSGQCRHVLAAEFGVTERTVRSIGNDETWTHLK